MNNINLIIPQFVSITRSYSQKVNLANHVKGHDYESLDFFASYGEQVPVEEATPEKLAEVSNKLYQKAKTEVEKSVSDALNSLKSDNGQAILPTAAEIAGIAHFIKELSDGGKDKVDSVAQKIAAQKDTLSEAQLVFLRQLALSIKNS